MQNSPKDQDQAFYTACGGSINNPEEYPSAEYQGRQVYFCLPGCLRAFRQDPDRFMAGEIEHPSDG